MFKPEQLNPLPEFSWQAAEPNANLAAYQHSYRLDSILALDGVYHCFGRKQSGDFSILTQAFIHPDNQANVFLLHGLTDHLALYHHLILVLVQAGFNVVGIDLPGHGLSSGERVGIQSFDQYQQAIEPIIQDAMQQLSGPWAIIGHSTGGAIAMDYVSHHAKGFNSMILLAPLVIPLEWNWVKLRLFALRPFLKRVPRFFNRKAGNRDFSYFVRNKDPLQTRSLATSWVQALYDWQAHFEQCPASDIATLVIQGKKDNVVNWPYNLQKIREKFSNLQLCLLKNARHHIANDAAPVRQQAFEQILQFLPSPRP